MHLRFTRAIQWLGATVCFLVTLGYSAIVVAACSCSLCTSGFSCSLSGDLQAGDYQDEFPSADFRVGGRWRTTATEGRAGNSQGTPRTLTWGLLRDGTSITGSREGTSPSNLISWLDGIYGAGPGGAEFDDRPWFDLIESSFERWEELSGLTFNYESADLGAPLDGTASPAGSLGRYADHRIGGHRVDAGGADGRNVLAYNYFPDHADMVIDTFDGFFNNTSSNSRRLRNVIMHEIGHGLGFNHLESSNSFQLMEPSLSTAFDGPQIDDILAVQRNYGDSLEKNGGNDTPQTAFQIQLEGTRNEQVWSIGKDGASPIIAPSQTDFVSIDGLSDRDYYAFTVDSPSLIDLTLTQVGRTYREGPQGGEQSNLVTSELNDLSLEIVALGNVGRNPGFETIAEGIELAAGNGEIIESLLLTPGREYYAFVRGTVDNVQLYQLDLNIVTTLIPEPASVAIAMSLLVLSSGTRRKR